MNIAIWVVQILAALGFTASGLMKLATPKEKLDANPKMGWAKDFSAGQVKLIGTAELVGAIGLVVPWTTGIVPTLTPVAGVCLALLMAGAARVHVRRKEAPTGPIIFGAIALLAALARSGLVPLS